MSTHIVELSLRVSLMSSLTTANRLARNGASGDTLPAQLMQSDEWMSCRE